MTKSLSIHRLLAGTALSLVALTVIGGCSDESAHPPLADVNRGWTCEFKSDRTMRALGTVTNHSSKQSFYVLDVEFVVDGHVNGSTQATVDEVDPGETAGVESATFDARRGTGTPNCVVSHVDRFKA